MVESTSKNEESKGEVSAIKAKTFGNITQKASPFLRQKKSWDDEEEFTISAELKKGIIDELCFTKPSNI